MLDVLRGTGDVHMSTDEIMTLTRGEPRPRQRRKWRPHWPVCERALAPRRGVLVDSNVLLDIATNDPKWSVWSGKALAECAE